MIYVLVLWCSEDYCRGSRECNQIYYLHQLAKKIPIPGEDAWVKLADIMSATNNHEIWMSPDPSIDRPYDVGAKLQEYKGCYKSFEQGFSLLDALLHHEDGATLRYILLPEAFTPRTERNPQGELSMFRNDTEFLGFAAQVAKGETKNLVARKKTLNDDPVVFMDYAVDKKPRVD